MHSTFDFCPRPAQKDSNVPLKKIMGGRAYFAETFKGYNSFETESEAWLPTGTTYSPIGINLFELLRTKTINCRHGAAGGTLNIELVITSPQTTNQDNNTLL